MRERMTMVLIGLGLMVVGALAALVVVIAIDPACGADGDSQRACVADLMLDLTGGR